VIYCLDTDILIEYFRGSESIKNRIKNLREDDSIGLTWLSVYEFFKGIFASGKLEEEGFLSALVNSAFLLDETYESSRIGGEIYAALKKSGNLINDADILIASIVKHYDAVLVTNNEGHFKRVSGLKIENWLTN
jgi:tRNA(fMet)-specific endonuclease VapC